MSGGDVDTISNNSIYPESFKSNSCLLSILFLHPLRIYSKFLTKSKEQELYFVHKYIELSLSFLAGHDSLNSEEEFEILEFRERLIWHKKILKDIYSLAIGEKRVSSFMIKFSLGVMQLFNLLLSMLNPTLVTRIVLTIEMYYCNCLEHYSQRNTFLQGMKAHNCLYVDYADAKNFKDLLNVMIEDHQNFIKYLKRES